MRPTLLIFLLFAFGSAASAAHPVKIIFDTDMESDVDDVGALAMLHSLADLGEAEILAVMISSLNPWSAPTADVVNTWFGRPDLPVGNKKTLGVYRNSVYARPLIEAFPHDLPLGEAVPDAVPLYREILAGQPDNSVVIVTVGYLSNLAELLESEPDQHSPLSGRELVERKVQRYVCMGGRYPAQLYPGKWGNFLPDPGAVRAVAANWPGEIIFTGGGDFANSIPTGGRVMNTLDETDPVHFAYRVFFQKAGWAKGPTHHSADLIAVYVAVRGPEPFFSHQKRGYNHIFEDGTLVWRRSPDRPNHSLVAGWAEGADPEQAVALFDDLMIRQDRQAP